MTKKSRSKVRVRHKYFPQCYGYAIEETIQRTFGAVFPACLVVWDKNYHFHSIMATYNLVFIVPAPTRKV